MQLAIGFQSLVEHWTLHLQMADTMGPMRHHQLPHIWGSQLFDIGNSLIHRVFDVRNKSKGIMSLLEDNKWRVETEQAFITKWSADLTYRQIIPTPAYGTCSRTPGWKCPILHFTPQNEREHSRSASLPDDGDIVTSPGLRGVIFPLPISFNGWADKSHFIFETSAHISRQDSSRIFFFSNVIKIIFKRKKKKRR